MKEASNKCDATISAGNQLGSCFKGRAYPFVPIKNYTLPNGDKLYCDCKYAIIYDFFGFESAVTYKQHEKSSLGFLVWNDSERNVEKNSNHQS